MITLARHSHPFPILAKSAAIALVAAASLSFSAPSAHAGAKELAAVKAKLTVSISAATSAQLYQAFKDTIADAAFDKTTEYGIVIGEIFKAAGANAQDVGDYFGTQIPIDTNPKVVNAFSAPSPLISLAAKTAGSGTGLNVSQIPDFVAGLLPGLPAGTATTAAINSGNKPGAGAILAGNAQILADDAARTAFANTSIANKKLTSAAQDITRWIATTVGDTANYAVAIANANPKLTVAVATGAGFGDTTNVGNIVHALFNQAGLNDTTGAATPLPTVAPSADVLKALNAGASKLATDISAGADIEEIQKIGNAFGQQIAKSTIKAGKGDIALSKAAGIVKSLAQAVINKPRTDSFGVSIAANQDPNKQDEVAEVAAYVLGGLIGSPELSFGVADANPTKAAAAANKAAATILALITNATSVKPKVVTKVNQGPTADKFAADVAASVALTVETSSLAQNIKDAVKTLLTKTDTKGNPTTAIKINKTAALQVKAAIDLVYAGNLLNTTGPNIGKPRFENGNSAVSAVSDPETDSRPFSVAI
jgi:hypothetical protein